MLELKHQMLDKDGHFLSHLLTTSSEVLSTFGLSYDVNTYRILVGSDNNNKLFVYTYIDSQVIFHM